jgi:taurine dioxygenase
MSTAAEMQRDFETISVHPMTPTIGAEISGVRMSGEVSVEQVAEIRRALLDWKVIFFRDQDVEIAEHVEFGRKFGELEVHPFTPNRTDHPEVVVIHHDETSKTGENTWHSDVTWRIEPSLGSILRGKMIPEIGGDTLFADMYAAYDGLMDEVKEKIEGKTALHSFVNSFGLRMTPEKRAAFLEQYPEPHHPIVRTHPETGRRGLYVNKAFTQSIDGMEEEESAALLKHLYLQARVPEYQCRFKWQPNSVAFWDNRAAQHYAAFDYHPNVRRVERVTIIGDKPV